MSVVLCFIFVVFDVRVFLLLVKNASPVKLLVFVKFEEMWDVFVEMLLVFVEMIFVFVEISLVFVETFDVFVEILPVFVAIFVLFLLISVKFCFGDICCVCRNITCICHSICCIWIYFGHVGISSGCPARSRGPSGSLFFLHNFVQIFIFITIWWISKI